MLRTMCKADLKNISKAQGWLNKIIDIRKKQSYCNKKKMSKQKNRKTIK